MSITKKLIASTIIGIGMLLASCSSDYQPKPKGYFRIDLPQKQYTQFKREPYPFTFKMPDSLTCDITEKDAKNDLGFNINYSRLRCSLFCDYKPVNGNLRKISEDCREFVYKHTSKADNITEQRFENPEKKVWGVLYELQGNVASPIQFVLTDSSKHFFRGALYPNNAPNADSLAPVTNYIKQDIVQIIESFNWKQEN